MRIGELARRADCPVETIRYYEKEGLLAAPRRSGANYRDYGPQHAAQLDFIRRCRALDMSLPEIRALLDATERPEADCAPVNALLDVHIAHVSERIAELTQLKSELDAIRSRCQAAQPSRQCGILQTLAAKPKPRRRALSHVGSAHGRRPQER